MQDTEDKTEIVLQAGQFYRRRETMECLGQQNDLLAEMADQACKTIKTIAMLEITMPQTVLADKPEFTANVALMVQNKMITLGTKVPYFPIYSTFDADGNGRIKMNRDSGVMRRMEWFFKGMDLWFFVNFNLQTGEWVNAYIMGCWRWEKPKQSQNPHDSGMNTTIMPCILRFPNVYCDGRFCFGNVDVEGSSMVEMFQKSLEGYFSSQANHDLSFNPSLPVFDMETDEFYGPEKLGFKNKLDQLRYWNENTNSVKGDACSAFFTNVIAPQYPNHELMRR